MASKKDYFWVFYLRKQNYKGDKMISKINNSPSFGMAFRQEKVRDALMPLSEKTLQAYQAAATGIDKLSEDKGVDVFLKGVETAADASSAAEPVLSALKLSVSGKGEEAVSVASDITLGAMPKSPRQVKKFFDGMKSDIAKVGILDEIRNSFGI